MERKGTRTIRVKEDIARKLTREAHAHNTTVAAVMAARERAWTALAPDQRRAFMIPDGSPLVATCPS